MLDNWPILMFFLCFEPFLGAWRPLQPDAACSALKRSGGLATLALTVGLLALGAQAHPATATAPGITPNEITTNQLIALQMRARGGDTEAAKLLAASAALGSAQAAQLLGQVWLYSKERAKAAQAVAWLDALCAVTVHEAQPMVATPTPPQPAHPEPNTGPNTGQLQLAACVALGQAWFTGTPALARDAARAQPLLRAAAQGGSSQAALHLGQLLHQESAGIAQNTAQAVLAKQAEGNQWLAQAARAGEPLAMFLLAQKLREGIGCEPDPATALAWLRAAAGLEYPPAVQELAMAYQHGELGLPQNPAWAQRQFEALGHVITHPVPGAVNRP
jgi:TPR repeat protein